MLGLGLMFGGFVYLSGPSSSVLESTGSAVAHRINWAQIMLWKLPQGFQFSLTGLLLIAIFTSRLAFGIATLPLALPGRHGLQSDDFGSWRRLLLLIWFLVGIVFLPVALLSFITTGVPFLLTSRLPSYVQSDWFSRLSPIIGGMVILGIALCIAGRDGRQAVRNSIRLPGLKWPLLALAFPIAVDVVISTGQYVLDRSQWAVHEFGKFAPPQFQSYFDVPSIWLLLLFFGAFFEELVFRGLLQPRFIHRYGLYRGIFLVGIAWAAFHFFPDFSFSRSTDWQVLSDLAYRLFMCLALSFVLAWLTLRSGSVVPAAIAHTFFNMLVVSPLGPPFAGKGMLRVALWTTLAYVLFRYRAAPAEAKLGTRSRLCEALKHGFSPEQILQFRMLLAVDRSRKMRARDDLVQPDYAAGHSSRDIPQRQGTGRENRSIRSNFKAPRAAFRLDRYRGFDLR
jgi:membrane protease YdiL (CAAX protease family)